MSFLATTKVRIARGADDTEDDRGDPVESAAFGSKKWLASIIEKRRLVLDPTSGEQRAVSYAVGRIDARAGIREGDRLLDSHGRVHLVEDVTENPRTLAGMQDVRFTTRGSGTTAPAPEDPDDEEG